MRRLLIIAVVATLTACARPPERAADTQPVPQATFEGAGPDATPPTEPARPSAPPPTQPAVIEVDVIVVGDGLGAVGAAVQAGRRGHNVVLLSSFDYVGGQAGAAGVTSFDDASGPARDLLRESGLYAELLAAVREHYARLGRSVSACYFSNINTFCPEPHVVRSVLDMMLTAAGVRTVVDRVVGVTFDDERRVSGVETDSGDRFRGLVIDATEFGDLIPLAGAAHGIGDGGDGPCVQDMTHAVIVSWYPEVPAGLAVPEDAKNVVAQTVGASTVEMWLDDFRSLVAPDGQSEFTGWSDLTFPIDPTLATWYRGMPDSRRFDSDSERPEITVTGINLPNDVPVPAAAVRGGTARDDALRMATLKSYLYMWYDRWELGRVNWAVASHLGYQDALRLVWLDEIPDEIERHMPPGYYVREARRLTGPQVMLGADIVERGVDVYPDSVLIGGDRSDDDHGECGITDSVINPRLGPYDAPLWVFIPADVDGFLVGVARNGNVDRSVASSIRMHAPELLGGQAVGMLAALSVEQGVQPRQVAIGEVRAALAGAGVVIDVPG